MILKLSMVALLLLIAKETSAQFTKSMPLKPIYKSGHKYFYGTKRVNSAHSLQIPLEGIEDPEVSRYYNSFKTLQNLRGYAYLPAIVFLFSSNASSDSDSQTFLYLLLGGLAGDLTLGLLSHGKMGKAIDIYNVSIARQASMGLQLEKLNHEQTLISLGFRQLF